MATVAGVDDRGRIQLVDGRTLPANYQHFSIMVTRGRRAGARANRWGARHESVQLTSDRRRFRGHVPTDKCRFARTG
jgi:hypothetical protein